MIDTVGFVIFTIAILYVMYRSVRYDDVTPPKDKTFRPKPPRQRPGSPPASRQAPAPKAGRGTE